ncbi:MAG: FlgO family outer membrane protein [Desulfovibrionaceae bacterium]|nr:FlgO family outer membrane protein [Desulfovibrionaceae bacterium]
MTSTPYNIYIAASHRESERQRVLLPRRNMVALGLLLGLVFMLCVPQAFAATIPQAASAAGREMDRQVVSRLGQGEAPAQGVSLCITTPVDVNDLTASNPLARQMQEEIARWFVQAGYNVVEIRKGADILFEPSTGEMLLTREDRLLGNRSVTSAAIITGTYTVALDHVRFNIRMVRTKNREVLAMSTITLPLNREIAALARGSGSGSGSGGSPIAPTVVTMLP